MTSISSFFRPDSFWALCNRCNVQYEYTNIFLNQTLLCYRCHQPFLATAIPVQSPSSRPRPFPNQQEEDMHAAAQPSASRTSQAPSSHAPKKYAKRRRNTRELSQRNKCAMLIEKAKTEILHQLNEWEKEKRQKMNEVGAFEILHFQRDCVEAKPDDDNGSPSPSHFPCVSMTEAMTTYAHSKA
ncbi:hypothetical protein SASPL_136401 [Salvia splendens]|uniref:Zinc beta-ribbon domain-containing protein n=1 Tax=Salvia splendens TaxID=180675 RepID=A0A8X8X232_SALSN|nr:hypothetical protein SASPL_136401 [Salvia splendens]